MDQKPKPSSKSTGAPIISVTKSIVPDPDPKPAAAVELIGFAPSLAEEGPVLPSKSDAAALAWRSRGRWMTALAVLAVVSGILFAGPKVYRAIKEWRAKTFALQGEALVKKKQIDEALNLIRAGYVLSPNSPEILRAMAQTLTEIGSPDATSYWNWLLQSPEATDDDRRAAIGCAMQNDHFDEALTMIKDLLARDGGDSRNQLIAARWSAQRGTPAETMAYATRAVNDDPTNKEALLFLAGQELANKYLYQEGVKTLLQLAESNDDTGIAALRQLAGDPNLPPADIDHLLVQLHAHPITDEKERLDTLNLEIKRHPEQRKSLINGAVTAHQNVPPEDLATFCEWLLANNEAPLVLKLIPRERALSDKSLCFTYLDCLAELNRWDDIQTLLKGTIIPLEASLVELYLSRCADETGDAAASDRHWQNAIAAAAYNPVESLRLADYAETHGQTERAAALYRTLTQEPIAARIAYLGLVRVYRGKDLRIQRDLLDQIAARWPKDPELVTQDILTNLLLNEHVPEMHSRAVALLANDSYNLSLRTNVALACLRLNDPAGALQAYNQAEIDWNNVPVGDLVVYAATLNANKQGEEAHRLLYLVNRRTLRPEYRALIKSVP